jgi:2,4-dienoyl-CoA reductase-like NADH-dependent reductase (Old Yellow Enzyme family)
MELRNRFVRSATWSGMAGENGEVTEPLIDIYREVARGGVGLILTGYAFVNKRGKSSPGMLGCDDDSLVPGLRKLVDAVHTEGGRIALQIVHGGSQRMFDPGLPPEAPSAVRERATGNDPGEMSLEDIRRTVSDFSKGARRAKEAGFDGVEIHAAHGYLLSQFLSPYSNRRTDAYGGSIEKRARIIFEIYEAVRDKVGSDFPVMIKINSSDFDGAGLNEEDSSLVSRKLSEMGIDAIELSGGIPAAGELSPAREKINTREKEAYFRAYAKKLKPGIKCPLILVGGLRSLEIIEETFHEGTADFFSLARPLVSEPDLIKRWLSGDRRRARCISCNKCMGAAQEEGRLYCVAFYKKDHQSPGD